MEHEQSKTAKPSNDPTARLSLPENMEHMSASALAAAFEQALDDMTDTTYDGALVDAYLEALDQKAPMPEAPAADTAYAAFCDRVQSTFSPITQVPQTVPKPPKRPRRLLRTALIAAVMVAAILGSMVVAQAAGANVFGAIARWTEETFSFGEIREETSTGASEAGTEQAATEETAAQAESVDYTSLQDVLDAYGITEVTAPTWLPDGYALDFVDIYQDEFQLNCYACYTDGQDAMQFQIISYTDSPTGQYEKTTNNVELLVAGDQAVYVFENTSNSTVAWVTEHYECSIMGNVNKDDLITMLYSMFDE